ncbi:MAG TPA: SBBP repeat-containing protein [Pyrinomonadaceae bacterium]|nr:SBBP repeat-containing protein [Pyrinomonadaceae bacterium]
MMTILLAGCLSPTFLATSTESKDQQKKAKGVATSPTSEARIQSFGELPLTFELNKGQLEKDVKFLSRGSRGDVFLTSRETILCLGKGDGAAQPEQSFAEYLQGKQAYFAHHAKAPSRSRDIIRMRLLGAKANAVIGTDELPGVVNYFIGKDPSKWHTNVRTFGKVIYRDVYPGIDQVFYGTGAELEYDFVVSPKADASKIKLAFTGVERLHIDQSDLVLQIRDSEDIRLEKLFAYQQVNGVRVPIAAQYVIGPKHEVSFKLGSYDKSRPLIIDPVLSYSTYFGGSGNDAGFDVAVDGSGNAYVTGSTDSTELSPQGGSNAFVAKLNAAGTQRLYLAIIGGMGNDTGFSLAVNSAGEAYVTGVTDSTDFPVANAIQSTFGGGSQDAFVTKLNANGSLLYSGYFGGSGNDAGFAIAVDNSGNSYVTGSSDSGEFSTLGNTNVFVIKLNSAGNDRSYLAMLGGSGDDTAFDIAADGSGNAYIVGSTDSANFSTASALQTNFGGSQDAFVAKLNSSGAALTYSTYLGGTGNDSGFGIAVDSSGNAYVTGSTDSTEISSLGGRDVFVAKFNSSGSERTYFTILGGSGDDAGFSIAVDSAGNASLTGSTDSSNFTTSNPLQPNAGGSQDVFVAKLSPAGSTLDYSTFVGNIGNEAGFAVAVDNSGNAYATGFTSSTNFPTANPAQPSNGGNGDAFVLRISGSNATTPVLQLNSASYVISEGESGVLINVTRSGDTTGSASVKFATNDSAGLQDCNVKNGIASPRCDFIYSLSTLTFGGGETSKSVFVGVVDDSYAEGVEIFTISLSNSAGASMGTPSAATITINDNEGTDGANPLAATDFFIRQHYNDFLGREPEPAGLAGWRNVLNNCGVTVAPPCDRIEVSSAFFRSPEFQGRGYFIYRFYPTIGKVPIYGEFTPDFAKVSGFLSDQQLEAARVAFVEEFMARADFQTRYSSTFGTPSAYVDALLQTVGLTNHPLRQTWINQLNSSNTPTTRAQVLRALVESSEMYQKFYNEAFVLMQYFGYLRRTADASYLQWIQTMNSNGGDYRVMINGFLNSTEYRQRFGP